MFLVIFFFQAEGGIRDLVRSRGLGDVYKRQVQLPVPPPAKIVGKLLLAPLDVSTGAASESAVLQLSLIHI